MTPGTCAGSGDRSLAPAHPQRTQPCRGGTALAHVSGAAFRIGTIDLTLGASYGHGNGSALPIDLLGTPTDVRGTYRSLKVIFGLQLAF